MPDLLVRGVAASVIKALKERAGAHGRSSEAEHRQRTREGAYLSVITVGALHRGIERIRLRSDAEQATLLADWLTIVLDQHADNVLAVDADAAPIWGRLRVRDPGHARDKQIAAIARVHDLTVVMRNTADFEGTRVRLMNPFASAPPG